MEFQSGNIFIRQLEFAKRGDSCSGHAHNFDHTHYCVKGGIRVFKQGEIVDLKPGEWVLIEAGKHHRMIATQDNTLGHCIYSHRTPQGEVVQEYPGWEKAYA